MDEFQSIARLFRPLTRGAPEALGLMDDAAVIPSRPGYDLIVTKDALVEGVHFLADDPPALIARKLLRVNLSDLAAKGAEPYAYFLAAAWPKGWGEARRAAFAEGLDQDQTAFGLTLLGGDTVSTPGPLTLSATLLGWVPNGGMVKRSGAMAGDVVLVSGTIGDGHLGLGVAQNPSPDFDLQWLAPEDAAFLLDRYRLPQPRLALRDTLRRHASAAADVSDGLLADLGHIGEASSFGIEVDLARMPLSAPAQAWAARQADHAGALARLATGGDDYEVVCTVAPAAVGDAVAMAARAGVALTPIGKVAAGAPGLRAFIGSEPISVARAGWAHG